MKRTARHLALLPVFIMAGCFAGSGPGQASRSGGPLDPDDLPSGHTKQVTTIEALAFDDQWAATEHRFATLNAAGDPLEVVFLMDHPTRAFDTALTYSYDDLGLLQRQTTWHWKQNRGWTEIARVETEYDDQDRPVEERASSLDAEGWIDARLIQYGYDHPDGSVSRVISVPRYDDEGMPDGTGPDAVRSTMWRNDRMEERFMTDERLDSVRTYSWQDGRWVPGNRTIHSYSDEGELVETVIFRPGTHTWVPFLRTTYTESVDGEHVALIHNRRGSEWAVTRRETTRQSD